MAEAIGHPVGPFGFRVCQRWNRAAAISSIVLSFLRERSVPIELKTGLSELPQFERYHLVIALSAAPESSSSAAPQDHATGMDVADLDRASGSPEQSARLAGL